jgi:hypothetical protein
VRRSGRRGGSGEISADGCAEDCECFCEEFGCEDTEACVASAPKADVDDNDDDDDGDSADDTVDGGTVSDLTPLLFCSVLWDDTVTDPGDACHTDAATGAFADDCELSVAARFEVAADAAAAVETVGSCWCDDMCDAPVPETAASAADAKSNDADFVETVACER